MVGLSKGINESWKSREHVFPKTKKKAAVEEATEPSPKPARKKSSAPRKKK